MGYFTAALTLFSNIRIRLNSSLISSDFAKYSHVKTADFKAFLKAGDGSVNINNNFFHSTGSSFKSGYRGNFSLTKNLYDGDAYDPLFISESKRGKKVNQAAKVYNFN